MSADESDDVDDGARRDATAAPRRDDEEEEIRGYAGWQVLVSAAVAVVVMVVVVWWAHGLGGDFESLFRVAPTVEGASRGVGADWVAGNTEPALDFAIAFVHALDVIMGLFILFLVFVHWASFRRLADRMRQPEETRRGAVATDGGLTDGESTSGVSSDGGLTDGESTSGGPSGGGDDGRVSGGDRR